MDEDEFYELDEDDMIDEYASEVNLFLTVIGKIDEDLVNSVITNTSKIADFDLTDEELDEVIMELGFSVKNKDNVVDVVKKIRDNS
jgi:hypothetical protein